MSHIGVKTCAISSRVRAYVPPTWAPARSSTFCHKAGVDPMEIDLCDLALRRLPIEKFFPSTGSPDRRSGGMTRTPSAYHVSAACSGFLFRPYDGCEIHRVGFGGNNVVVPLGALTRCRRSWTDTDRSTCPIFGDGAAAVLLEPNEEGYGVLDEILRSDGSASCSCHMKAGGSRYPASVETVQNNWHTIMWDGHAVFKAAVSKMADASVEIMERNGPTSAMCVIWCPIRPTCVSSTPRRAGMGLEHQKCMINIDRNGNTTAATIPSCLYDYEKELRKGDNPDSVGFRRRLYVGRDLCECGLTTVRKPARSILRKNSFAAAGGCPSEK